MKLFKVQLAMANSYGRFIDDSRDSIISQVELVFKKDHEFARGWTSAIEMQGALQAKGRPDGASPVDRPGQRLLNLAT